MKIGIIGDAHFSNRPPVRRIDDYLNTHLDKLKQCFNIFGNENCNCIIQVGDFFDSHTVSNKIISEIIRTIFYFQNPDPLCRKHIFCIAGQHDLSGNTMSSYQNSPLNILESSGAIITLHDSFIVERRKDKNVVLYGSSFGQDVPQVEYKDWFNILVTHRMIGNREIYPDQEITKPKAFLKKYPDFDAVFCGDYHYRFAAEYEGRVILNPGALVRKTIDKRDLEHKPGVYIFDTETKKYVLHLLDVKPIEEVFDFSEEIKTDNTKINELIELLKVNRKKSKGWKGLLFNLMDNMNCSKEARSVISEFVGDPE